MTRKTTALRNWIADNIRSGRLEPGAMLPTREALMKQFDVSRWTVDQAVSDLAREGLVTARRGAGSFVTAARKPGEMAVYVVPSRSRLAEFNEFEFLAGCAGKTPFRFIKATELGLSHTRLLNEGARVIWDRPSLEEFAVIRSLREANVSQILVNRSYGGFNHVATDVAFGIREGVRRLAALGVDAFWEALVPPPFTMNPLWAGRHSLFCEEAIAAGHTPTRTTRTTEVSPEATARAVRTLLSDGVFPKIVFTAEPGAAVPLADEAARRGIEMGRDLFVLVTDYRRELRQTPGVVALEQPWKAMYQAAARWAESRKAEPLQRLFEPTVHSNV